jgi:hypothetical protein
MKSYSRVLIALFVAALVVAAPSLLVSQQLPVPIERSILPGAPTTIEYAGQRLTFTPTGVALLVKLRMVSFTEIELRVKKHGPVGGGQGTSGTEHLRIYWENFSDTVYDGDPPSEEWVGGLNTEGGWTEK